MRLLLVVFESTLRQIFANNTVTDVSAIVEETAVSGDMAYQIGTYSEHWRRQVANLGRFRVVSFSS